MNGPEVDPEGPIYTLISPSTPSPVSVTPIGPTLHPDSVPPVPPPGILSQIHQLDLETSSVDNWSSVDEMEQQAFNHGAQAVAQSEPKNHYSLSAKRKALCDDLDARRTKKRVYGYLRSSFCSAPSATFYSNPAADHPQAREPSPSWMGSPELLDNPPLPQPEALLWNSRHLSRQFRAGSDDPTTIGGKSTPAAEFDFGDETESYSERRCSPPVIVDLAVPCSSPAPTRRPKWNSGSFDGPPEISVVANTPPEARTNEGHIGELNAWSIPEQMGGMNSDNGGSGYRVLHSISRLEDSSPALRPLAAFDSTQSSRALQAGYHESIWREVPIEIETGLVEALRCLQVQPNFREIVSTTNNWGQSLAHLSICHGYSSLLSCLVDWRINLTISDGNGFTALHYAYMKGDLDSVRILRRGGASEIAMDKLGRRPLDLQQE
jgi:hypothetical protein